ncbi:hypothetical protein [Stutzerimonas azotifigens]|uniref:hypothetical protein n=1 Tax=Stutzerimonas azotifigens TaxID=291995 RepID=UPI0004279277|nr:hypothetical protein [Stutzerimonas azotifigens]
MKEQHISPDPNSFDMATHMDFGLSQVLPSIARYAADNGHPIEAALVACFMILSTALHVHGVSSEEQISLVDVARPQKWLPPETMQ